MLLALAHAQRGGKGPAPAPKRHPRPGCRRAPQPLRPPPYVPVCTTHQRVRARPSPPAHRAPLASRQVKWSSFEGANEADEKEKDEPKSRPRKRDNKQEKEPADGKASKRARGNDGEAAEKEKEKVQSRPDLPPPLMPRSRPPR